MIPHSMPSFTSLDREAVINVMSTGFISEGPLVGRFENEMAMFLKTKYAVSVNSGTSALHLSLLAVGVRSGDEVILPSYVCSAVLNAVNYVGAVPVLADTAPDSPNISADDVERKISAKTKAIIVPHMFGFPANMKKFMFIREKYDIPFIEDSVQSIGASYCNKVTTVDEDSDNNIFRDNFRSVGSWGDLSILSFYSTKMMATGQGGMILSNYQQLINEINDLKDFDKRNSYKIRYNYKMTSLQASLGISQLKQLPDFITKRREIASFYKDSFSSNNILFLYEDEDQKQKSVYYRFVIITKKLKKIRERCKRAGIICEKPVFLPLHRYLGLDNKKFPNTESIYKKFLSIPIYPLLSKSQQKLIINTIVDSSKDN